VTERSLLAHELVQELGNIPTCHALGTGGPTFELSLVAGEFLHLFSQPPGLVGEGRPRGGAGVARTFWRRAPGSSGATTRTMASGRASRFVQLVAGVAVRTPALLKVLADDRSASASSTAAARGSPPAMGGECRQRLDGHCSGMARGRASHFVQLVAGVAVRTPALLKVLADDRSASASSTAASAQTATPHASVGGR